MPTDLGEEFSITWRGNPQQMLPPDVPLWHLFLDRYAGNFERFFYNVRVGGPDMTRIDASEAMKKMWYDTNAKRIDAIGEKKDEIWIIEVASRPNLRAVGQMVSYHFMWDLDPKINKPVKDVLLCYFIDSDLEKILKHYGVTVLKIPQPQK